MSRLDQVSWICNAQATIFCLGGGGGGQSQQSSSKSGFETLPPELQQQFINYGARVGDTFNSPNNEMFTPLAQTAGETKAINATNAGFTPTASSLASDISMQTNPFDSSVIDTINKQAAGQGSALSSAATQAGQLGSNRQMLGANDIDLSRLNQIGTFKQNEYNTALSNAMTTLPQLRAQDAASQMGVGTFERGLDTATKQAPVSNLQAYGQLMGAIPVNGSNSTSSGNGSNMTAQI